MINYQGKTHSTEQLVLGIWYKVQSAKIKSKYYVPGTLYRELWSAKAIEGQAAPTEVHVKWQRKEKNNFLCAEKIFTSVCFTLL